MPLGRRGGRGGRGKGHHSDDDESTPICRCRVLYLGSAVPHITKDGLQGIQEPLKELYPDTGLSSLKGIDSWLSVWSNGLLLENVDEKNSKITRFFPIESLHYCAAVRHVLVPSSSSSKTQKFLPLDSPFAQLPNLTHPPLFASILRRTSGIKVLECHAFICKREMAANALVRSCFHAYADSTYVKQLEGGGGLNTNGLMTTTNGHPNGHGYSNGNGGGGGGSGVQRSVTPLDSIEKVAGWQAGSVDGVSDGGGERDEEEEEFGQMLTSTPSRPFTTPAHLLEFGEEEEGDENHKIWAAPHPTSEVLYLEPDGTLKSIKSHSSRLSRPRQFVSPPPPPPPPPQLFTLLKNNSSSGEEGGKSRKKGKKGRENGHLIRPASMMNLTTGPGGQRGTSLVNGPPAHRPNSAMSTMNRNRYYPMMGPPPPHPLYAQLPFPVQSMTMTAPKSKKMKKQEKQMLKAVPILAPTPMLLHPPPPPHFTKMGPAQYATIERGYHYHPPRPANNNPDSMEHIYRRGNDEMGGGSGSGSRSETYEGIYRKKGHLNERAFSHSIREESRARSYGGSGEGVKKEREIIQMVRDLELSGTTNGRNNSNISTNGRAPNNSYMSPSTNGRASYSLTPTNGRPPSISTNGRPPNSPYSQSMTNGESGGRRMGNGIGKTNGHPPRITHR